MLCFRAAVGLPEGIKHYKSVILRHEVAKPCKVHSCSGSEVPCDV